MLPRLRLVLLVELERRELGRERTLAPGGPEPHVDFVQAARFGRRRQGRDEPLRQARIVKPRTQSLPAVRLARVSGKVVDEHEVEIGGRGHFARAELAERDNCDPAAADAPVLGRKGLDHALEQRGDQPLRQRAIGAARTVGVEAPGQEIEPDMKRLLGGEVARPVQSVLEALPLGHKRLDPRAHRLVVEARSRSRGCAPDRSLRRARAAGSRSPAPVAGRCPSTSPNNSRTDAFERRIDKSSTLAGMRASASSKAESAASASPDPAKASSSAGVNSVSTSRARALRTAERRPKCQPRTVSAAASGR